MSVKNKIDWDSVMSPFRHFEYGINHNERLYPTPIHILVVLLYGEAFYERMAVLDNYDAMFLAGLVFSMRIDSALATLYRSYFVNTPDRISDHAKYLGRIVSEQYPLLLMEVTPNRSFSESVLLFCSSSTELKVFCECYRASFVVRN